MAKIRIDNREHDVDERKNLLDAALSLGYDLPYFCWHPCLDSVGACRQCAVKQFRDADDEQGSIVMACMTPAAEGTRIALNDADAVNFRARIIEWLMINHPHDCPVCEEGGECHLQDMTLMTGHTRRRYRGTKRTHRNQDLGPFISHEMNRCIACYRCVRYYRDYAGGEDLEAFAAHDNVYFGRHEDGTLENPFSGNLVEVCPTGVFTDKTLGASYTRKWDLQAAPGICQHCSLGCNISPGARDGVLKRVQNRYHGEINGYFLCDRGRFGAGFVNRDDRPRQAQLRSPGNGLQPAETDAALQTIAEQLRAASGVIGIGSPRASLETNHALRELVGADHFSTGMAAGEQALVHRARQLLATHPGERPSLRQTEHCDAVLILGEDVTNTAARLALSLRQSVRGAARDHAVAHGIPRWHDRAVRDIAGDRRHPLFIASTSATALDDVAAATCYIRPADIAALGRAVAHALDASQPAPDALDPALQQQANAIANALAGAERPLVVAGTGAGDARILDAAAAVAGTLGSKGHLFLTLPECNSLGVDLLGGMTVDSALAHLVDGSADTLVVVENDLYQRASSARVDAALEAATHVIVIDHSLHATLTRAHAALPAGSFAEADGTLVNNEGRAQRFFQVYAAEAPVRESWRWCAALLRRLDRPVAWESLDDVIAHMTAARPGLVGVADAAPGADFRIAGMRLPRGTHRYSGRTALHANVSVHEPTPPRDPDSPLAFSMEGWPGRRPGALLPFAWSPGWDSNQQAITKFQDEVGGALGGGDPGVRLPLDGADETDPIEHATSAADEWLAVPLHHLFGGEAQSALAPAMAGRIPTPYAALNAAAARELNLTDGDTLTLTVSGEHLSLPVRILDSLADRSIGLPVGLPGLTGLTLPAVVAP
ncbi:NADH-quinone oxidoreductase subunit NuoG [Salinisphaera sp. P385]|uniref:NADH-quinone oxidoreductase n=1 Tax=Spectribacter acetivorans TaxID=3075603 RepID=A0ABU3B6B5_9GAMM|nr:NADH-quinone oxidoreductase subunit NuoG [Salinisphaera sp. P385]MDT0617982.1 NADH-quinone oxidoreductase subunit NuoG [Salinisphaera sp. P385]